MPFVALDRLEENINSFHRAFKNLSKLLLGIEQRPCYIRWGLFARELASIFSNSAVTSALFPLIRSMLQSMSLYKLSFIRSPG